MARRRRPARRQHQRHAERRARRRERRTARRSRSHLSTRLPGNFWVVEVRRPGPVASLPYRDARAGTTFELEAGGRVTLLAPYPFVGALDARVAPVDRGAGACRRRCCRISNDSAGPIHYGYVTRQLAGVDVSDRLRHRAWQRRDAVGRPSVHRRARHAAGLARHSDRAAAAAHRRRQPGGSRAAVRGVLPRAARRPPSASTRRDARGRRVIAVGTTVVRALETVTDEPGPTSPGEGWTSLVITPDRPLRVGQRDDHRLSRAARDAPGDGRTGDRRGRRRRAGVAPRSRLPRGARGGISVARVRRLAPDHRG